MSVDPLTVMMERCRDANSIGIQHLLESRQVEAVEAFKVSLQIVKRVVECYDGDLVERRRQVTMRPDEERTSSNQVWMSMTSTTKNPPQKHPVQLLYMSPLYIAEFATFTSRRAALELSVAIIFNMALSRHLLALDETVRLANKDRRTHALLQALQLYELAYRVVATELDVDDTATLNMETPMAIVNNMGHIYMILGKQEEASRCFQQLLTNIIFVQQQQIPLSSSGAEDDRLQIDVEAMLVFVRSVEHIVLLAKGFVAGAPAA